MEDRNKVQNAIDKLRPMLDGINKFVDQYRKPNCETEYAALIDEINKELSDRSFSEDQLDSLQTSIDRLSVQIFKSYLPEISASYTPIQSEHPGEDKNGRLRVLKINRWLTNQSERSIDKLKNTYNALFSSPCRFALIFHRTMSGTDVYMALYSTANNDPTTASALADRFTQALQGNFPGVDIQSKDKDNNLLTDAAIAGIAERKAVAVVTNIATEKSEDFISQGIEKLLDAYCPKEATSEYTLVLLCKPLSSAQIDEQRALLSAYYTALSPFAAWQSNSSGTRTVGVMDSVSTGNGLNASVNAGMPHIFNATFGGNVSRQDTTGSNTSRTDSKGVTLSYVNYQVKLLLERLEEQAKRLAQCEALGMWQFAAYVLSDEYSVAENIAQMYRSLTQGESSYIEKTAVNLWNHKKSDERRTICEALSWLEHPGFKRNPADANELPVYATSFISGTEISQALNMPQKAVSGFPVYECAEFGRNVVSLVEKPSSSPTLKLGKIMHMRKLETGDVALSKDNLTAHTFITGSTGSGKSNTIYTMLHKLCLSEDANAHFLVIEPAKGEYKDVLGGYDGVAAYGTNAKKLPLLRLNPFSFPDDIHVLEHIDRLVEIFNACWPMYAAMPAVLKEAIEAAYLSCGWSLTQSECTPKRFPTFVEVMKKLPDVINQDYSADTKGDYVGALVTRIKSLTNGINGQIFCSDDEIANELLFDQNVIIDLSRVGVAETKALLMGILVMKLQEYRMSVGGSNQPLKHVTVLEEAHNLLRRTSSEQSQESSNLQGKSVEMLANAIAEMRTYGEGFIIADQSPGLMDMSVIRNTNTKIIMRLPDEADRMLVGKAAGLNDDQIVELSKLNQGVAAVFQNDWMEAVLCAVDYFKGACKKPYKYTATDMVGVVPARERFLRQIITGVSDGNELRAEDVDRIKIWIDRLGTGAEAKSILYNAIESNIVPTEEQRQYLSYCMVKGKELIQNRIENSPTPSMVQTTIDTQIADMLNISLGLAEEIRKLIFLYAAQRVESNIAYRNDLLYYGGIK